MVETVTENTVKADLNTETNPKPFQPLKHKKYKWRDNVFGLVTTLLPLISFLFFNATVLVIAFVAQFTSMEYYDISTMTWNNFETFKRIFSDSRFFHSLGISAWLLCSEFVSLMIALAVSVLLSKNVKGSKVLQVLYFIPYICSSAAVSLIWMRMFGYQSGIVNSVLVQMFGEGARIEWQSEPVAFTFQIFIANMWKAPGYGIVMYKAAILNVDPGLYEAAKLDGAGGFTQFWKITLPLIAPTTFYLLFAGIMAGLMMFDMPKLFVGNSWDGSAGVEDAGLTIVLYSYIRSTTYHDVPGAAVITFVLFIICFALSFTMFKIRNKLEKENA